MAVTSQDWLTGFQPMVNPPPVDYLSRYHAGLGYGPGVFASIQRADAALQAHRDEQEAAERQARYREQAFGEEPDELPAYLAGPSGLQSDRRKLQSFAAAGDLVGMRDVLARMRKMRERHADALVAWQGVAGDGDFGKTMADAATALSTESFLDDPVLGQQAGGLTVRAVLDNSTPEARARAADRAATEYGVSVEAGDIITNQENPLYHVLDDLRARQAEGALLAKSARTSEAGEAIGRQSKSALTLYSDFLARQAEDGDWDAPDLGAFVKSAGSVFGGAVSSGQLQVMSDMYRRDKERAGRAFSADDWMRRRKAAVDAMVPVVREVESTGEVDRNGQPVVRYQDKPDVNVDQVKLHDLVLQAYELAQAQGKDFTADTLERAVARQYRLQYEVEKGLGESLEDLGVDGGAAAYAAVAELAGDAYLASSDAPDRHLRLKNTADALRTVRSVLGYAADGTSTDPAGFKDLTDDIVSGVVRAQVAAGRTEITPDFVEPIKDALKRHAARGNWKPDDAYTGLLAGRILDNLQKGRSENISTTILDTGGFIAHASNGDILVDQNGRPVLQSPDPKVDLTTGKTTRAQPTGNTGFLSTKAATVDGFKSGSGYAQTVQALNAVEQGDDPMAYELGQDILRLQRKKIGGEKPALQDGDKIRGSAGRQLVVNFAGGDGASGLKGRTAQFFSSGAGLKFLQEADKESPTAVGSPRILASAWEAIDELASEVAGVTPDRVTEKTLAKAELLAHLLAEALNRGKVPGGLSSHDAVRQVLERTGTASKMRKRIPESPGSTYPGVTPVSWRFEEGDLSDADSQQFLSALRDRMVLVTGAGVSGKFREITGYELQTAGLGHRSASAADDDEYGGVLAKHQQLTWIPPVSDGTPTASNAKNAERPPVTDRENALAYLGSVLAPDQRLNMIRARMMAAIPRMVGSEDKELVGATLDGAMRDLDHVYQNEGLAAALDMAMQYEHGKVFYLETQVPRHDAAGNFVTTETLVRPKLLTNDQIRDAQTTLGVDRAGLDALSRLNYKSLPNTWKADDRWSARTQASALQQEQ